MNIFLMGVAFKGGGFFKNISFHPYNELKMLEKRM